MSLNETQRKVLDAICIRGGGCSIHEAMEQTGLDYKTIERTAYELVSKGYEIRAFEIGCHRLGGGTIERLFLSPYDPGHSDLIKK